MKRMIFIFLDGVGVGDAVAGNPFYSTGADYLPFYGGGVLPCGTPVKPIDALLGVGGIPQSASGQSSLYTGENVPALLQGHGGSYPNKSMRKIIKEKNLLSRLKCAGLGAVFLNAYPLYGEYFTPEHILIDADGGMTFGPDFPELFKRRISVTTCMMVASGQSPFTEKHIRSGDSIFQEYTNRWLNERGEKRGVRLPEFTPEQAAEVLYRGLGRYDFVLYEFFLTDVMGHRGTFEEQCELVGDLNRLLGHLLGLMDPERDTLLLTSDHGNIEDSATASHTLNPVPLVVWGNHGPALREKINSIADVTPSILDFFKG